ncbi:MAG: alpha/beta fold hydrolase [Clostridia bacterium]|nr:alpha/beta fold hydrolase [Clostridia bacterium]
MQTKSFVIRSHFDDLSLHGVIFTPDTPPKGIVQISHGMCEYKERYEGFMRFFAEHGYIVACYDQRGHGDSVLSENDRGFFYERKAKAVVEDAAQITRYLRDEYPNLPVILFGHSMGSMIVRCYLHEHDDLIDKLIVCGSPSNNPLAGMGIFVAKFLGFFRGQRHRSKMLAYLATGKGNMNFPGESYGCWLSQNRESIEEFYNNPKGRFTFTCNGFENLFRLMKNTYDKKRYKLKNPDLPVFFVSGSDDAVLISEEKFHQSVDKLKKAGYKNVSFKIYKGLRHEIFHDIGKDEVMQDLLNFIE